MIQLKLLNLQYLEKYFQDYLLKNNDISDVQLKRLAVKIDLEEHIIDIEKLKSYKIIELNCTNKVIRIAR